MGSLPAHPPALLHFLNYVFFTNDGRTEKAKDLKAFKKKALPVPDIALMSPAFPQNIGFNHLVLLQFQVDLPCDLYLPISIRHTHDLKPNKTLSLICNIKTCHDVFRIGPEILRSKDDQIACPTFL